VRSVPRKVVRELHAALKEAESKAAQAQITDSASERARLMWEARNAYQHITARGVVTLLAALTDGHPEGCRRSATW
jgi:hypothetical protein